MGTAYCYRLLSDLALAVFTFVTEKLICIGVKHILLKY